MYGTCRNGMLGLFVAAVLSGCDADRNQSDSTQTPPVSPAANQLTTEDFRSAVVLKNRGIGQLENLEWEEAGQTFQKLVELVPDNRLALRNLAIARVLAVIDRTSAYKKSGTAEESSAYKAAVVRARNAVRDYRQQWVPYEDQAISDLLLGKLLVHDDSFETPSIEEGLALLRRAVDILPARADLRFALAMAMDGHRDYTEVPQKLVFGSADEKQGLLTRMQNYQSLVDSLQAAFRLAPENLAALEKLLQRQALGIRNSEVAKEIVDNDIKAEFQKCQQKAGAIVETLESAKPLIQPLNESIKKQRRIDLLETIQSALKSYQPDSVSQVSNAGMIVGNLLRAENATRIDLRRIDRHLLEYMLLDFDDVFRTLMRAAGVKPILAKNVIKSFSIEDIEGPANVSQLQMLDMNLDGFEDLVVLSEGRFQVYSRGTDLTAKWELILAAPDSVSGLSGFVLADIDRDFDSAISELKSPMLLRDRDGDQKIVQDPVGKRRWFDTDHDVVVWNSEGVTVLRNEALPDGSRELIVLPQAEQVTGIRDVIAGDLEADGDLDLVFATDAGITLWQNTDGSSFINMNDSASLPVGPVDALALVDWDRDIGMDVVATSAESKSSGYLQNILHGRFRWLSDEVGLERGADATVIAIDEIDRRESWDIAFGTEGGLLISYVRGGAGSPMSVLWTTKLCLDPIEGVEIADLDNDGRSDVVTWSASAVHFYRGFGTGSFEDLSSMLPAVNDPVDLDVVDYDDDGDLDLVVSARSGKLHLIRNEGGNSNHWMKIVARGKPDDDQFPSRRVNAHATGAVLEVRCAADYQGHIISRPVTHVGLGQCEAPEGVRIIWTDGVPQNVIVPDLLKRRIGILAPQILDGSCPYIYTWTGTRFEFFSDCLWAAPLGLTQANGEIAPTREWENLLIPGTALVEKDGRYLLQLTEELHETAYFDNVQLTAVDHPADTQLFTNEKVGPADMAAHQIHTVRNPLQPLSITDKHGRDLLPGLAMTDSNYVQPFDGRIMQGLTDEWWMEFDLGRPVTNSDRKPEKIRLFLIGWVFPTDTSLNLGIEQNPELSPPAPPSLEVPDGHGGWKVVRPFIGFPSGKTKAMVVDISDIFSNDDYRFRLKSSMELYWDRAFYTADEVNADSVAQDCPPVAADLHYRGFSRRTYADNSLFRNGHAPEGYDYDTVTTDPRWPPVAGRFTRYGNCLPLLTQHDDRMVVMGAGDELTIEFEVPVKPVRKGWNRDFVLRNVGYDKDADLNTIYGQSSEPFPFRAMSRYPFATDDETPDSAEYNSYLHEWQNREYSPGPFWQLMRNSD